MKQVTWRFVSHLICKTERTGKDSLFEDKFAFLFNLKNSHQVKVNLDFNSFNFVSLSYFACTLSSRERLCFDLRSKLM